MKILLPSTSKSVPALLNLYSTTASICTINRYVPNRADTLYIQPKPPIPICSSLKCEYSTTFGVTCEPLAMENEPVQRLVMIFHLSVFSPSQIQNTIALSSIFHRFLTCQKNYLDVSPNILPCLGTPLPTVMLLFIL
jgi:hypothetical protein